MDKVRRAAEWMSNQMDELPGVLAVSLVNTDRKPLFKVYYSVPEGDHSRQTIESILYDIAGTVSSFLLEIDMTLMFIPRDAQTLLNLKKLLREKPYWARNYVEEAAMRRKDYIPFGFT